MRKLIFLSIFLLPHLALATEQSELDQAIKQLQSAKAALNRANHAANGVRQQERVYFDYFKARQEIDLVIQGIRLYVNGSRAQPRDPSQIRVLTGDYDKVKATK